MNAQTRQEKIRKQAWDKFFKKLEKKDSAIMTIYPSEKNLKQFHDELEQHAERTARAYVRARNYIIV